jgi:predicted nuclease of predicted toxin-antitoxin system
MKFFANENIFEPIIDYLRNVGKDILSIREAGLSGISDNEVYQLACKEERVIITMDKDFSRMFRFPPEKCGGIIVVKIYRRTVDDTLKIFKKYFSSLKEEDIKKNLVIVTPENVRIHRSSSFKS